MKVIFKTIDGAINIADMKKVDAAELVVENLDMINVSESLKIPNLEKPEDSYYGEVVINKQHIIWYVLKNE